VHVASGMACGMARDRTFGICKSVRYYVNVKVDSEMHGVGCHRLPSSAMNTNFGSGRSGGDR
jgi:hypothetical protein